MRAILLAAGSGKRLLPLTKDKPKCLLEVGGKSIVQYQLEKLALCGINDVVIVTGHGSELLREECGDAVTYIHNADYDTTNSLYSLWLAREYSDKGCLIFNADVMFHLDILKNLINSKYKDCIVVDFSQGNDDEAMKVRVVENRVMAMSKKLPEGEYHGENLGLIKLSPEGADVFFKKADEIIGSGVLKAWAPYSIDQIAEDYVVNAISTTELPWIEIDFIEDLERANNEILPKLS